MGKRNNGITASLVVEYNTSGLCAHHDVKIVRHPRGVLSCSLGHKLHIVNGALNIMKLGVKKSVEVLRKPLSFLVSSKGVSTKGGNAQDLSGTLAGRGGQIPTSV